MGNARVGRESAKVQPGIAGARRGREHPAWSALRGPQRVASRTSAHERDAHARAGAIASAVAPLAHAPRPAVVVGGGGGLALPDGVAAEVGDRLGADLSHVRLYEGEAAAQAAAGIRARAFTAGNDVVFGRGEYAPDTTAGRQLIAHELVHAARGARDGVVMREPDRPKDTVRMHFDGRDLIVYDGDTVKFRISADSGRPVLLRAEDAEAAHADARLDTYMNDRRFVGVKDFGPIPEGRYRLSTSAIQRFTLGDELKMLWARHSKVTTSAGTLTGGDWGEGRVPLLPIGALKPGPFGNTNARDGFYLHGGWAAGSSGCIDIGTSFGDVADWLADYKRPITVTVAYEHDAPTVRAWTGFTGAAAYGKFGFSLLPQLAAGVELQGDTRRTLVRPQLDAVLRWAGGALSAGARLDVAITDKEQFVRVGLGGGLESRLFHALYAQIYGGYSFSLSDSDPVSSGAVLGGSLKYDLGRVQLGLVYDHLWAAKGDPDADRLLLQLGVRL